MLCIAVLCYAALCRAVLCSVHAAAAAGRYRYMCVVVIVVFFCRCLGDQARELEAARDRAQALSKADTEGRKVTTSTQKWIFKKFLMN